MQESQSVILTKISLLFILLVSYIAFLYTITTPHTSQPTEHKSKSRIHKPKPKPFTFPGGERKLFPHYRFVGLYGTPSMPELGVLGEQPLPDSIARVKTLADSYQAFSQETIYSTFEIIASVASSDPTENNDYSQTIDINTLRPWVDAAKREGVYILLDLQPGRTDFLTQAKEFESLLKEPHVGLALDPEWRLAPHETHLNQIGHVGFDEINQTAQWLASLVKQHKLPQKLFLIHQFQLAMIDSREQVDASKPELTYMIQMDGQGNQQVKQDTWSVITATPPANFNFGWKNFIDEDLPMRSPQETMQLTPTPWYVSYQ